MKSSLYSLNPFLPSFSIAIPEDSLNSQLTAHLELWNLAQFSCCNCQLRNSTQFSWQQQQNLILAAWDPRYIAWGRTHGKYHFLHCCTLIHCCKDVFTAQSRSNKHSKGPQTTILATPLLLLCDITVYMVHSSAACVWTVTQQRPFLPPQFLLWGNMPHYLMRSKKLMAG
jgi:hypothetical protein